MELTLYRCQGVKRKKLTKSAKKKKKKNEKGLIPIAKNVAVVIMEILPRIPLKLMRKCLVYNYSAAIINLIETR